MLSVDARAICSTGSADLGRQYECLGMSAKLLKTKVTSILIYKPHRLNHYIINKWAWRYHSGLLPSDRVKYNFFKGYSALV